MITMFCDQQDAYTKNAIFRRMRESEKENEMKEDWKTMKKIIIPSQFSNIYQFPDRNNQRG